MKYSRTELIALVHEVKDKLELAVDAIDSLNGAMCDLCDAQPRFEIFGSHAIEFEDTKGKLDKFYTDLVTADALEDQMENCLDLIGLLEIAIGDDEE